MFGSPNCFLFWTQFQCDFSSYKRATRPQIPETATAACAAAVAAVLVILKMRLILDCIAGETTAIDRELGVSEALGCDGIDHPYLAFQHFTKMEGIRETVANWAASASGSKMLMAVASTTMGILLATFIRTKIFPLILLLVKFVLNKSCALVGLVMKLVPKQIFQRTVPVRAAATTGAENDVELEERDEGATPCKAQAEDV